MTSKQAIETAQAEILEAISALGLDTETEAATLDLVDAVCADPSIDSWLPDYIQVRAVRIAAIREDEATNQENFIRACWAS